MKAEVNNNTPPTPRRAVLRRAKSPPDSRPPAILPVDLRTFTSRAPSASTALEPRSWLDICLTIIVPSPACGHPSMGAGVPACVRGPAQDILGPCAAGGSIIWRASKADGKSELSRRSGLGTRVRHVRPKVLRRPWLLHKRRPTCAPSGRCRSSESPPWCCRTPFPISRSRRRRRVSSWRYLGWPSCLPSPQLYARRIAPSARSSH